jgi:hypothetical protein
MIEFSEAIAVPRKAMEKVNSQCPVAAFSF